MNRSLTGSHLSFLFAQRAIFPRWHTVVDRCPISTSATGRWRDLMQSTQLARCSRVSPPGLKSLAFMRVDDNLFRFAGNSATVDGDGSVFSDELAAAARSAGQFQQDIIAVDLVPHLDKRVRAEFVSFRNSVGLGVPGRMERFAFRPYLDRAGQARSECPLDLVETMSAPTGHFATGPGPERNPTWFGARCFDIDVVRHHGGLATPDVPVQAIRGPVDREDRIPTGFRNLPPTSYEPCRSLPCAPIHSQIGWQPSIVAGCRPAGRAECRRWVGRR